MKARGVSISSLYMCIGRSARRALLLASCLTTAMTAALNAQVVDYDIIYVRQPASATIPIPSGPRSFIPPGAGDIFFLRVKKP